MDQIINFVAARDAVRQQSATTATDTTTASLLPRPAYPREEIAKRVSRFQFPKSVIRWATRPIAALSHRPLLFHRPPECHVVMCGFPRSGTTLCQLMIQACVPGVQSFPKEEKGLAVARDVIKYRPYLFTKRPKDIFAIEEIRSFYATSSTKLRFILLSRDPRAVLTSFHEMRKGEYYVSVERWRAIWEHWNWAVQFPDVLTLRFEELISRPDTVEQAITAHVGWQVARPFSSFHEAVPAGFDTRALNGVRPLDTKTIAGWRAPRHHARLLSLLAEMPELPERLIEMGYEADDAWIRELEQKSRSA